MNAISAATSAAPFPWKMGLLVFVAVLLLSLPQAMLLPLLDRDEPRFAEASREMLQSGNFIVPTFNHAPRYAKPPLIYWCQAVCYTVFGENAFAARLPSLLATAATALLLFAWGAQMGGIQVGLGAGVLYAFCLQAMQQGRVATADALLIFFMTLTAFAGWKLIISPPANASSRSHFRDAALVLAVAGGFLAKGPEALLPFVPLLVCAGRVRRGLVVKFTISLLLGLALVLVWALPACIMTHGDYWRVGLNEGIGERMVTGLQGHGATTFHGYLLSLPLYLLLFWVSALPWSPLIVAHVKKLFGGWKPDPLDGHLLFNAGLIFLIFSLMVTKLPHYTLPAFPFLSLAFARRWKAVGFPPGTLTELGWITGILFAVLASVLIPFTIFHHATPSPVGELVREAGPLLTPSTEFALVDFQEPNAIWEVRRISKNYGQTIAAKDVPSFLRQPGPRAVVLSNAAWDRIRSNADPDWRIFSARGWNAAKGWDPAKGTLAFVDLTLVVKP